MVKKNKVYFNTLALLESLEDFIKYFLLPRSREISERNIYRYLIAHRLWEIILLQLISCNDDMLGIIIWKLFECITQNKRQVWESEVVSNLNALINMVQILQLLDNFDKAHHLLLPSPQSSWFWRSVILEGEDISVPYFKAMHSKFNWFKIITSSLRLLLAFLSHLQYAGKWLYLIERIEGCKASLNLG